MHDPQTQAFVIPYGWRTETWPSGRKWRYWKPFITIWHNDPCRDGSDDSCGWSRPRLNKDQRDICKSLASDEVTEPWFMRLAAEKNLDPILCESLLKGAFALVGLCLRNRGYRRLVPTNYEIDRWALELAHNSVDNFRSSLCFLSGYHSNWYREGVPNTVEEDRYWREEQAARFFRAIMGYILRERRFWFQHPKWHIHHWKLQFHLAQTFKRWAFSRCCKCGGRFKWGYAPTTYSWHGTGPRWFHSEKDVFHRDCDRPNSDCAASAQGAMTNV